VLSLAANVTFGFVVVDVEGFGVGVGVATGLDRRVGSGGKTAVDETGADAGTGAQSSSSAKGSSFNVRLGRRFPIRNERGPLLRLFDEQLISAAYRSAISWALPECSWGGWAWIRS
jgi:hypothetical protein